MAPISDSAFVIVGGYGKKHNRCGFELSGSERSFTQKVVKGHD